MTPFICNEMKVLEKLFKTCQFNNLTIIIMYRVSLFEENKECHTVQLNQTRTITFSVWTALLLPPTEFWRTCKRFGRVFIPLWVSYLPWRVSTTDDYLPAHNIPLLSISSFHFIDMKQQKFSGNCKRSGNSNTSTFLLLFLLVFFSGPLEWQVIDC